MEVGMSSATMEAAVLAGPRGARIERVARPEPGPGTLRVKLEGCGVCGSNLPVWEGREWFRYPMRPGAPGHEGWGVVDAVGSGVTGFQVGQRVAALSSAAYAEYDVVGTDAAVLLPPALAGKPFPGEPLGCAMNIFRRADLQAGQTVAIIGIGFLGALVTRLATNAGARVLAITRRPYALELARLYGAAECIPMDDHSKIIERVKSLTHGTFCDRVIEVVGEQWPLDLAGELTRERGKLVIAGYHQDGPRQVNMQLWNWRGLDVVNAHERDPKVYVEGIRLSVDEVAAGRLDPFPLFTHRFGLDELNLAFETMRTRPEGFLKALITV
ncbi:zinc-binding dehydrogenase [Cystobacter fuscus]|nr:zinc-binding dehydrogenase [Cystobacter fuscus]